MSADFSKILVKDDVLNVTDDIGYAVLKGAQQITPTQFTATSFSNSTHTFSCQIPSEQTLICREVLWRCTFTILLTSVTNGALANPNLVAYGAFDSFAAFPLQRLLTSLSVQINNNTVSQNYTDILPILIRQMDTRRMQKYSGSTPTRPDVNVFAQDRIFGAAYSTPNLLNPQNGANYSSDPDYLGNGSFVLDNIVQVAGTATTPATAQLTITVTEPLLMSPFIWGQPESNNQAIYGVQNLNFTMQIASDPSRAFRSGSYAGLNAFIASLPANAFSNSQLLMKFYTPHPSSLMPSRNVIPYSEYLSFRTAPNTPVLTNAAGSITSNSIQLNQVPSKIIIGVAPPYVNGTNAAWSTSFLCDWWLRVDSISLQWNNGAGILSTAVPYDLYKFSKESGSNQSWVEFTGTSNQSLQVVAGGNDYINTKVPMSGSLVMLQMAKHIQLVEDFYSAGSIGNFNLSVRVNFTNQSVATVTPALTIYVQNEGIFVTEKGSSSTFTALLNKNDVLDASMQGQPELTVSEATGLAGNGMPDKLLGAIGRRHQRTRMGIYGIGKSGGMQQSSSGLSKYLK
jgi:hypothetical protein